MSWNMEFWFQSKYQIHSKCQNHARDINHCILRWSMARCKIIVSNSLLQFFAFPVFATTTTRNAQLSDVIVIKYFYLNEHLCLSRQMNTFVHWTLEAIQKIHDTLGMCFVTVGLGHLSMRLYYISFYYPLLQKMHSFLLVQHRNQLFMLIWKCQKMELGVPQNFLIQNGWFPSFIRWELLLCGREKCNFLLFSLDFIDLGSNIVCLRTSLVFFQRHFLSYKT